MPDFGPVRRSVEMLKQLQMGMRAFLLMASRVWTCVFFLLKKQVRAVSRCFAPLSAFFAFTIFITKRPSDTVSIYPLNMLILAFSFAMIICQFQWILWSYCHNITYSYVGYGKIFHSMIESSFSFDIVIFFVYCWCQNLCNKLDYHYFLKGYLKICSFAYILISIFNVINFLSMPNNNIYYEAIKYFYLRSFLIFTCVIFH